MGDNSERTTPRDDRFYTPRALTNSISSDYNDYGTPRSARELYATPRSARQPFADSKSETGSDYYATPRSARQFDDPNFGNNAGESSVSSSYRFGGMRRNSGSKESITGGYGYPPTGGGGTNSNGTGSHASSAQSSPRYYTAAADLPRPYEDRSAPSSAAPSPRQRPGMPVRRSSSGSFSFTNVYPNSTHPNPNSGGTHMRRYSNSISEYDDYEDSNGNSNPNPNSNPNSNYYSSSNDLSCLQSSHGYSGSGGGGQQYKSTAAASSSSSSSYGAHTSTAAGNNINNYNNNNNNNNNYYSYSSNNNNTAVGDDSVVGGGDYVDYSSDARGRDRNDYRHDVEEDGLDRLSQEVEILGVEDSVSADDVDNIFRFARHGRCEEMERLLDMGIPINIRDDMGSTLLIIAAQNGNKKILKAVLRRGGNINARNFRGCTALHYCYQFGYWDTIGKYLISKGADSQIRNNAGKIYTGGVS